MHIFPAIDLYEGKAVRLYKGDYNQMTVYSDNPLGVAHDFETRGARFIHIVDLEGAKTGTTPNIDVVCKIATDTNLFIEIGGGIRNMKVIEKYLNAGVGRVILGTAAVEDEEFLREAISKYGNRVAVGADVKDGYVAVKGWTETSKYTLDEFCKRMQELGVKIMICTDISKDGAMMGTNYGMYLELKSKYHINIIASGGISSIEDIQELSDLNIYGAIIGSAYYKGTIDLKEALKLVHDKEIVEC